MIDRLLQSALCQSQKSILLLGPRQTGKSTLIYALKPALTINLAREAEYLAFSANPNELEERLRAERPATVFIDEVQRLPGLLNTVQAVLDEGKAAGTAPRFFLTGSSARKLRRGNANLLPGRVLSYALGPLVADELDYALDVRRALQLGALPEPYLEPSVDAAQAMLRSYAGTYLKEEIQAEALSRNIQGFSRFLTCAAAVSGQFLDYSKAARQARVSRTSTVRYFELLEDTLLIHRLPPFAGAASADLVKHARFYFFDPGVWNGLLGNFEASTDRVGVLFEHLLVSQLHASAQAWARPIELTSFRTRGGVEVDVIAHYRDRFWAIEAKATDNPSEADAAALVAARRYLPADTRLVLVTPAGARRRFASGVDVMSLNALLREMNG